MGQLNDLLGGQPYIKHYLVVDAAVLPELLDALYALGKGRFACLIPGEIEADLAYVAPYLAAAEHGSSFVAWLEERSHLPWGYVIRSNLALGALHRHLRRFAETRGPLGEQWWFRFWDPRVLRAMSSILTALQMEAFLRDIDCIYLADANRPMVSGHWVADASRLVFSDEQPITEGAVAHARL